MMPNICFQCWLLKSISNVIMSEIFRFQSFSISNRHSSTRADENSAVMYIPPFQQTLIFFIFTEKWRSFCSVSCAKQHSAEKCWIIVKGFVILTFCSCKFLIGAALCGCADTRKHKEIETYSPCCSLWLLKVSIRNCPQPERSQIFIIPTDNMLSKQPCILSKCPWISLRTPACSLTASHSEYEHQLNASNANAYYFSLKSDTAKMMKLYLVVVIF